jgi:hypothetical protein
VRKLVDFMVVGPRAVPWSAPIVCLNRRTGQRFTARARKTRAHLGQLSLDDWKGLVTKTARSIISGIEADSYPQRGFLWLHLDFYEQTEDRSKYGCLWGARIAHNKRSGKWTKRGPSCPDVSNCFKSTEDALQEVLFHNDVQNRMTTSTATYGPSAGVRVALYAMDENCILPFPLDVAITKAYTG